jgi:hypothetical protein
MSRHDHPIVSTLQSFGAHGFGSMLPAPACGAGASVRGSVRVNPAAEGPLWAVGALRVNRMSCPTPRK